jgi:SAM-dependent methyltransferase
VLNNEINSSRNWFDQGGGAYACFRPDYPVQLASFLAAVSPNNRMALDVGCGTGQLTRLIARHFKYVVGLDSSADQIANANHHRRIHYRCASAENLPISNNSVSLIVAAQAAHWFNLPAFYKEVRRVSMANGILALISYGVLRLEPELDERFSHFYGHEIGSFWPPERKSVDKGYADLDFPFSAISAPPMKIRLEWNLTKLLGYLSTWSAVRRAKEAGREDIFLRFSDAIKKDWGAPEKKRPITWPINIRIGRV